VFKKVEVLSGGEKNRLALARLTLDPGNFLLLDEPTNHLDLPTREALEDALAGFGGSLLFVSHDRYFINRVATRVAAFDDGRLVLYDGGYDDYLAALRTGVPGRPARASAGNASPSRPGGSREQRRSDAEYRNLRSRELRSFRERIAALEAAILPLETRLKEIEAAMSSPDVYKEPGLARRLGEEKKAMEIDLAHLYDDWDEATTDLQEAESRLGR
jgi:ATP-binding cassette subfamily F protein 3